MSAAYVTIFFLNNSGRAVQTSAPEVVGQYVGGAGHATGHSGFD